MGEENERQMANNGNCKEMRFVIRSLIDFDDVSDGSCPRQFFPEEEGMMQHSYGYFLQR